MRAVIKPRLCYIKLTMASSLSMIISVVQHQGRQHTTELQFIVLLLLINLQRSSGQQQVISLETVILTRLLQLGMTQQITFTLLSKVTTARQLTMSSRYAPGLLNQARFTVSIRSTTPIGIEQM